MMTARPPALEYFGHYEYFALCRQQKISDMVLQYPIVDSADDYPLLFSGLNEQIVTICSYIQCSKKLLLTAFRY